MAQPADTAWAHVQAAVPQARCTARASPSPRRCRSTPPRQPKASPAQARPERHRLPTTQAGLKRQPTHRRALPRRPQRRSTALTTIPHHHPHHRRTRCTHRLKAPGRQATQVANTRPDSTKPMISASASCASGLIFQPRCLPQYAHVLRRGDLQAIGGLHLAPAGGAHAGA